MNSIDITGNLVLDPRFKNLGTGKVVANMRVAVPRRFHRDQVDYIQVVAWQDLAEQCEMHLEAGRLVGVTGRLQIRERTVQGCGCKLLIPEIIADDVDFLGARKGSG